MRLLIIDDEPHTSGGWCVSRSRRPATRWTPPPTAGGLVHVKRAARLTHRRLEPGSTFWRLQAERLLSAFIWSEGRGPADGRLTVRDALDVAARWDEG